MLFPEFGSIYNSQSLETTWIRYCPSLDGWLNKLQYIYIMDNDSAVEKEQTTDTCSNLNESFLEVAFILKKNLDIFMWFRIREQ